MNRLFDSQTGAFAALSVEDKEATNEPFRTRRAASPPLDAVGDLDKTDGITARPQPEAGRGRAQEITSSFKVIPQISYTLRDWHGFESELDEWFNSVDDSGALLAEAAQSAQCAISDIEKKIKQALSTQSFTTLLYFALGSFASVESFDQHRDQVLANCRLLNEHRLLADLDPTSENIMELTLAFVLIAVGRETQGELLHEHSYIQRLVNHIASFRWAETFDVGLYTLLLRATLLSVFGTEQDARVCQEYLYKSCGVDFDPTTEEAMATPLDYEGFRQAIMARYPSYLPPDAHPQTKLSVYERAPPKPVLPNLVTGDVPASIEEACELFLRKTQKSPEVVQFWDLQSRFLHGQKPTSAPLPESTPPSLVRVEKVYNDILLVTKSFTTVILNYILQESAKSDTASGFHSACLVLAILLRWYRLSHIMKFEFLAAILFDLQFHLITYKYCASHAILETVLCDPKSDTGFWISAKSLSRGRHLDLTEYGTFHTDIGSVKSNSKLQGDGIRIETFSPRALEVFIGLVTITRAIITDKTQRIIIVAELPAEALKQLLLVYNRQLWMEALQIFKLQAPFNGKKWRSMNMELISAIYLHCPPKLNDNWLSGQDLSGEIKVAASQEETLRSMIGFYNSDRPGLDRRSIF